MTTIDTAKSFLDDEYAAAYPETRPFWEAAAQSRLLVKSCQHCQRAHWYPRVICPLCGSDETEWKEASGQGTLYAFSIVERTETPYVLAWVTLAEGPVMMTNIVDCDFKDLKIGQPVAVHFTQVKQGRFMPVFSPV